MNMAFDIEKLNEPILQNCTSAMQEIRPLVIDYLKTEKRIQAQEQEILLLKKINLEQLLNKNDIAPKVA